MHKRSQAALEFLTTYAWAFLVIIIMIGALAYFGILNPSRILPERCTFAEFNCQGFQILEAGTLNLQLKNQVGELITVTGATLKTDDETVIASCAFGTPPENWRQSAVEELSWTGCDFAAEGFVAGDKAKIIITLTFYPVKAGITYTRIATGEVFSTVQ